MNQLSRREQNRLEKQQRILSAALKVFAQTGYPGASMDAIAAEAGLTKPTLYKHFASKEALFAAVLAVPLDVMMLAFDTRTDKGLVAHLHEFAWSYAETVMRPEFLSLARLTIGEAHRFPNIGRDYQESGPDKVLAGLMAFMNDQRELGRLTFEDAELAAQDFWGLILSAPRNRALHVPTERTDSATLARYINNGISTFLRAYSTDPALDLHTLSVILAREGL